ncbi:uncharacterized protein TRIVIDRAFT_225695 [Trichoderma virens Gv29-8]|uniref:BTB domain-containing protein n=1 Tax=Hypocrea virens (strain Gv29-8 / FGSC 10586) TaxID=413071 RepID=G9N453_HYPVG|nr:uncharacterized protein TRIVIDRAFT_225695 [Trichoderma virens Gv29-8]EHK18379.1 hypothetical protein TRIVIDRAFT_225695 [Trichoderma virens Gv29-8]
MDLDNGEELDFVKDIALNGDVILVVGEQKVSLRAHSQCLVCSSKVFSAMLGPHWSEGKNLSQESPKEIPLIEDDAHALYAICCVIHHRNDLVPATFSPRQLLQIAIEVDKYDLHTALLYARAQWLQNKRNTTDPIELAYLMAAAFLFDDMEMFREHALALILQHHGSYIKLLEDSPLCQILPTNTTCLLEERRNRLRAEVGEILLKEAENSCSCGWGKSRSSRYRDLLSEYTPLKMLEAPISQVIERIKTVSKDCMKRELHQAPSGFGSSTYAKSYYHEPAEYITALAEKVETAKRRASICLDCVRSNGGTESCRFKHE